MKVEKRENLPIKGLTDLLETYDTLVEAEKQDRAKCGREVSRAQTRYWRRVPFVSVLPDEKNQLPANFLLRAAWW